MLTTRPWRRPASSKSTGASSCWLSFLIVLGCLYPQSLLAGWQTQWIDRFDGSALDLNNWTPQIQANYNGETQCYTDDDSSGNRNYDISGGILSIIARRQAIDCPGLGGAPRNWTSGRINSKDKQEFLYGRIESRIRFFNLEAGTWPAFWMLENRIAEDPRKFDDDFVSWPNPGAGEIDVWEWFSNGPNSYITNFFNAGGCGREQRYTYPGGAADVQQWHDYAIEWEADSIRFYVDDTLVTSHDVSTCAQYKEPMFVLLNVAIGGALGGFVDPTLNLATLQVDYVAHCTATTANSATRCNEATPRATSAPVITSNPPIAVAVNLDYRYTLSATDADLDALTLAVTSKPDWLEFDAISGLLSGTPGSADIGNHDVVLSVSGGGDTVTQSFTIEVRRSDTPPFILSPAQSSATIGADYRFQLLVDDADGDPLAMWITSSPGWLGFDPVSGELSGTPSDAYLGVNRVRFAVTDGSNTVTGTLEIEVVAARSAASAAGSGDSSDVDGVSSGGGGFGLALLLLPLCARLRNRSARRRFEAG